MIMFSGMLYPRSLMPTWLSWIQDVSICNYGFEALMAITVRTFYIRTNSQEMLSYDNLQASQDLACDDLPVHKSGTIRCSTKILSSFRSYIISSQTKRCHRACRFQDKESCWHTRGVPEGHRKTPITHNMTCPDESHVCVLAPLGPSTSLPSPPLDVSRWLQNLTPLSLLHLSCWARSHSFSRVVVCLCLVVSADEAPGPQVEQAHHPVHRARPQRAQARRHHVRGTQEKIISFICDYCVRISC